MSDEFVLRIEIGNDAMQGRYDVADALDKVVLELRGDNSDGKSIMDEYGNTVGSWELRSGIPERRLVIMQGAPGSGKSTKAWEIADTRGAIFSTDDYWSFGSNIYAFDVAKLAEAHAWNQGRVDWAMERGVGTIIVDNCNVLRVHAAHYEKLAEKHGYKVEYCRVDPGLDECLRRNAERTEDRFIPEDVIREMYEQMETLGQ